MGQGTLGLGTQAALVLLGVAGTGAGPAVAR